MKVPYKNNEVTPLALAVARRRDGLVQRLEAPLDARLRRLSVVGGGKSGSQGLFARAPGAHNDRPLWERLPQEPPLPRRLLFYSEKLQAWLISDRLHDNGFEVAACCAGLPLDLDWASGLQVLAVGSAVRAARTPVA